MLAVFGLVAPLFGIILLGYLSGRLVKIPIDGLAWLNVFIVYIALPALFFKLLSTTPLEEFNNVRFFASAIAVTFAVFLASFLIARVGRRTSTPVATIQGLAGAYGNIGYLGPPLALAAFGPEAGVAVAIIFAFENAMHFVLAPLFMAFSNNSDKSSVLSLLGSIVRKVFTHPFIIAMIIGIVAAYTQISLPKAASQLIDSLAGAAAPCALFSMGVTAALRPLREKPVALSYLVPIKLIIHPLLMYAVLSAIPGVNAVWVQAAVLLASLPTATNVFVLAQQYKSWEEQASSVVVVSTALSLVTVTTLLYMLGAGG